MTETIFTLGEFGFIQEIMKNYTGAPVPGGWRGIGDDCAVIPKDAQNSWLITTDMLVAGVHFITEHIPPGALGYKSLTVNLSDIAAMGGTARAAFLSIALPKNTPAAWAREFMQGFSEFAAQENVSLLGGDTTSSKNDICINVTVIGETPNTNIKMRGAARTGDIVAISRPLGASAAGLEIILNQKPEIAEAINAHYWPQAETRLGVWIGAQTSVHAMMDLSDGLLQDLNHILHASNVGAKLEIPDNLIYPGATLEQALSGGEDYALLFTVDANEFSKLAMAAKHELKRELIPIGHITPAGQYADQYTVSFHGQPVQMNKLGFDHFKWKYDKANVKKYTRVLTIAGSDSGGGAGIQADLKTFAALGAYGMSVITALTAQNTVAVTVVHTPPAEFVGAQLDAVLSDIGCNAVKLGMLYSAKIITVVVKKLKQYPVNRIVLDTVMISKSGNKLLEPDAVNAMRRDLFPIATLITPNLPEASVLLGREITHADQMEKAAEDLLLMGCQAVLLKGGHAGGENSDDYLLTAPGKGIWLRAPRIDTKNTHGTGCTYSAAIAVFLAQNYSIPDAVRAAKEYVTDAIRAGAEYKLGTGHGPLQHLYKWTD